MGQVTKLWLSCYLVLLSTDSKTRYQDRHSSMTWPIYTTVEHLDFSRTRHPAYWYIVWYSPVCCTKIQRHGIVPVNGLAPNRWQAIRSINDFPVHGGGHPYHYNISTKIEIQWNFVTFLFIIYWANHNEILHASRPKNCCDMCKISLWSVEHILNKSTTNCDWISNTIKIPLVGQAPGLNVLKLMLIFNTRKFMLTQQSEWWGPMMNANNGYSYNLTCQYISFISWYFCWILTMSFFIVHNVNINSL